MQLSAFGHSLHPIAPSRLMILVELETGAQRPFGSTSELIEAVRKGEVGPGARIYHRARDQWLPVTTHPLFRKTWDERPLPPLPCRQWTFFSAEPEEPLHHAPASPAEGAAAAAGGAADATHGTSSQPAWQRVFTRARRYLGPRRGA